MLCQYRRLILLNLMLICAEIVRCFGSSFLHITTLSHIIYLTTDAYFLRLKISLIHLNQGILWLWWRHYSAFLFVFAGWSFTSSSLWLIFVSGYAKSVSFALKFFVITISLFLEHTLEVIKTIVYCIYLLFFILNLDWLLFFWFFQFKFLSSNFGLLSFFFLVGPRFLFLGTQAVSCTIVRQWLSRDSRRYCILFIEHTKSRRFVWRLIIHEIDVLCASHDYIVFGTSDCHLSWLK